MVREDAMRTVSLPHWLQPAGVFDLIRLGRDQDGGYLVDSRDVQAADVLLSLGVCDDWSFEADFLARRDVPLQAFDGTVGRGVLLKRLVKAVIARNDVRHKWRAWRGYGRFFRSSRVHHAVMVGLDQPGYVPLGHILDEHPGRVFLSIDIEGWEYRILDDILACDRLCGLAVEFHDLDLHLDRVQSFVEALPMSVAHVHCNSFAPVSDDGLPMVVEVTFSSHSPTSDERVELPHQLDRPSSPRHDVWKPTFTAGRG
jgi:hypothetical protein